VWGPAILALNGAELVVGGVFPLSENAAGAVYDPIGVHSVNGRIFFLSIGIALVVTSVRLRADPTWRGLASYTLVTAIALCSPCSPSPPSSPCPHRRRSTPGSAWWSGWCWPCGCPASSCRRSGWGGGPIPPRGIIRGMPGYEKDKQAVLARLRRVEGQVRGLQRMVEEDRYCIDVLTQVSAVRSALENVALLLLNDHVDHCVADAVRAGDGAEKVQELTQAVERLVRSR
jgi:CsoR family transcriptional regulator, copper-sensing transcriptional repressor